MLLFIITIYFLSILFCIKILYELNKIEPFKFKSKIKPEKVIIIISFIPIFNTAIAVLEPYFWLKCKIKLYEIKYKRWKFLKDLKNLRNKNNKNAN